MQSLIFLTVSLILLWCGAACSLAADVSGIAAGVPKPDRRSVIVQLFNWPFKEVTEVLPELKALGYSHVHVSPAQRSNERVWQWWGRYQPIDFSSIEGPLGNEDEFRKMNAKADSLDIKIIADVVLNHMVDVREMEPGFVMFDGDKIVSEKFPQFSPDDFHRRCNINDADVNSVRICWLSDANADLKTETARVRRIAKDYLKKLVALGVDGFRFDAAKHIEPAFFSEVLAAVPNTYAFGEVITKDPRFLPRTEALDFYDFPLVATMREAFRLDGRLGLLKDPASENRALPGAKAVTFVRNHDIDRGQAGDRGIEGERSLNDFGIGWNGANEPLSESDIILAYAYIFGREDGLPYVFVDMPTRTRNDKRKDRFNDKRLAAFIRFHNLCLAGQDGVPRRKEIFLDLKSPNAIGWQRGKDRLVMINKSAKGLPIRDLQTTLKPGRYIEVHKGWPLDVQGDGKIREWDLPGQTAAMFVPKP
jgi:alpha-amylase